MLYTVPRGKELTEICIFYYSVNYSRYCTHMKFLDSVRVVCKYVYVHLFMYAVGIQYVQYVCLCCCGYHQLSSVYLRSGSVCV